jgi:hypothetical protein
MTLPRSVSEVLADHVTLEVECIDRMYLNVYVPGLQFPEGAVKFIRSHLGNPIASTVMVAPMTDRFVVSIRHFAAQDGVPMVDFVKGERKDDVMHAHLASFDADEGVLFVGRAQEKTTIFRTEKRRNRETGKSYPFIVRASAMVNHYYFYAVDDDFGPFFLKFCSYFPYNAKLCINGNEWAKRQAAKAGIGFEALDNGFASCEDPKRLQRICDRLGPHQIDRLLRKWLARLPHPYTARDRRAGYRYDLSILQAEFSLTQVLDRPLAGRVFFEETIRENLDVGRPDRVSLIFDRRIFNGRRHRTDSRFRTRVLTNGVTPSLHVEYKHSKIKQYHKEGVALRTETTVNDTRDFWIGRRLHHLPELRQVGFSANRRLLDVQRISHDPIIGDTTFAHIAQPTIVEGQRASALRFGDSRVHALLAAIVVFRLLPNGFANRDLRIHLAPLLGLDPHTMTAGTMTYDLRRLRLHGLIERIPHTHRYRVTDTGLHTAWFFTHAYNRVLRPGLADLSDPTSTGPLHATFKQLDHHLNELAAQAGLAA